MFGQRISVGELAGLCRRLSISLTAGLPIRTVWERETRRMTGWTGPARMRAVLEALEQGESLGDALRAAGDFFPPLFCEIAAVGDQTGHLGEAFAQLADHYDGLVRLRRSFLWAIAWPVIELVLAVTIVGALIYIQGWLSEARGQQVDLLGFGLSGARGLAVYLAIVGASVAGVLASVYAVRRGLGWVQPLQRLLYRLPWLGTALRTLALARLAWTLQLTFESGMHVRRAMTLSLRSTQTPYFTDHLREVNDSIEAGDTVLEALSQTGVFPQEFLDVVAMGEESGELVEAMGRVAQMYQAQAEGSLRVLTMLAGWAVWLCVAAIIIFMIFRLAGAYLGAIQGAF
ncbi:MAG: type II secretion system F family protein [Thermoguttaceae bacterium]|jgi:type II secretory pathway component PulF|nr:type II secretion system F family protein [Thermoguttaceae bacterium]